MPTVKLTVPKGAWSRQEKADLIARLTAAVVDTAKASGKGDIQPYVGVQIEETAEGGYAVGGQIFG